jgi:hypothetical protein
VAGAETPVSPTFLSEQGKEKAEGEDTTKGGEDTAAGGETDEAVATFDLAALKLPEGFTLDEETGKTFTDLLTNDKLSPQERAQAFMDLHTTALKANLETHTESVRETVVKENMDLWKTTNDKWREDIKALPEFKDNPDAEAGKVLQVLTTLGADEKFFEAMDLTGAGNHPAILQVLHRLTKPFMEGGVVGKASGQTPRREPGANIYNSANNS